MENPVEPDNLITPSDGLVLRQSATLRPGMYFVPGGITVAENGVELNGNGAVLIGTGESGFGVRIEGRDGVAVRNLRLAQFRHAILSRDCRRLRLENNHVRQTAETRANTVFLDIWLPAERAYGGAILLERVSDSDICGNDVQHQMCGLLAYACRGLRVRGNNASYSSGFGVYLHETSDSLFEENWADYCCRYEPRDAGGVRVGAGGVGHMGADAAGFVIVHNSCNNVFRRNFARLGGDGFFLAGRTPDGRDVGCNDNLFEENDGSLSPNIAFEGTFSARNIYRNNWADRCNYGFWLGFSRDCVLEGNRMLHNRQAGVAVENGAHFTLRNNSFQQNHTAGVLVWSKYVAEWHAALPDRRTAHDWLIEQNRFCGNGVAIALRADRDHGMRPMPAEACGRPELRPCDHVIRGNDIQENRIGVHLLGTDRVVIEQNTLHGNVEADIRREDDRDTTVGSNLGLRGGYL